jgi:hypothetical protein
METKKEIYREKAKAKLEQLNTQINGLMAKFDETKADTKLQIKDQFDELTNRQDTVERKYEQMKKAGEDAWQDMRSGLDDALDDLEESFIQASEKIEKVG